MEPRLTQASKTLSELIGQFPSEHLGDLVDLTLGALVSLSRAGQLGYKERIGKPLSSKYYDKLIQLANGMAKGVLPEDRPWLAGYYFNSGLFRLGAAREITGKLLSSLDKRKVTKGLNIPNAKIDVVYEEYRSLKHDLRSIRMGRRITYEQAVESLCELVYVLGQRSAELSDSETKFPKWSRNH
jgi:hypothetical protein